ncbi:amino acid adenylation domain-containing protein [Roseobacter sp.]|uniref:amino acid adenylation domain-containing protein n=1 Tax=Roseobacter sp. TaxID=1907202 RepID=UPI0032993012
MTDILDVFEMTPVQAGMLFQTLYDPSGASYVQQYWGRLHGALDSETFRAAWHDVIARHDMLRAQCHWDSLDHPAFAIHAQVHPDWQVHDWSAEPGRDLTQWLAQDRAIGFDMNAVPLMRFALIRLDAQTHIFVWTFHHILLDGWCSALVVRDVLAAMAGAPQRAVPPPFRTYLEWRETRDVVAAQTYWTQALTGLEGPTPLGVDRAATGATGTRDHRVQLNAPLTQTLEALCKQHRLTLATMLQGVWGLVLSRYSGQRRVTFGTVLSGRPADLPGAETMVGLFLNTVPVTLDVADDCDIIAWFAGIQRDQIARETYGHAALSDIQKWAGLDGNTPLFESLLIVENYPDNIQSTIKRDGNLLELMETGLFEQTNFPLVLKVLPGAQIEICLTADRARIPDDALDALADHLQAVLAQIVRAAPTRLGALDLLDATAQADLGAMGQGPVVTVNHTVLDMLLPRQGDDLAVCTPDGAALSYGALMARAAQIGATLWAQGVRHGDIVAICQDRTSDLLASLIAVWRCGAAYLPLDPIYPADRIAYILGDAGAALVLTDAVGQRALDPQLPIPTLMVASCTGKGPLPDHVAPTDIAYVLYTSGSTGRPKGVPISHRALANFLGSMVRAPGLGAQDRLLAVTTVAFDIAALELFGPLVAGGTVVIAPSGAAIDGKGLAHMLDTYDITVKQATPAGWRVLRDSGWAGRRGLKMLSGGEALDSALAKDLLSLGGALWNLYGPTETTIWSGALQVTAALLDGAKVPVGGPLDNTTFMLRDPSGRVVPRGVPGELCIGGLGLSPGYLGRPDLTARQFVHDGAARYYRTGDQMRMTAVGTLEFLGRLDDQIKLRGYRIELGEIEKHLEDLPDITQAVVVVRGQGNAAQLVAYLRGDGAQVATSERRKSLAGALPAYMIPSVFVAVDAFPMTPNGKIDRKALPAPDTPNTAGPVDLTEQDALIAVIWADTLGVAGITAQDDFFALGGHSLSALRVISEVRRLLDVDLSLRVLFDAPQFGAFCTVVAHSDRTRSLPAVIASPTPAISAAQTRVWLMARLQPEQSAYHLSLSLRLSGPLNRDALERAIAAVAARHSVLRTHFPALDGLASVEIRPDYTPPLQDTDLSTTPKAQQHAQLNAVRHQETARPFELERQPPWRVRLVKCAAEDHVLVLTLHHILADEWSFGLMLADLENTYRGDTPAPAPPVQYSDFAHWQDALDLSTQRSYWAGQLAQAPALITLPTDRARPDIRTNDAGQVQISVAPAQSKALDRLFRQNGVTPFMGLLAAYAVFLHRHSGDTDLIIGTPVTNRQLSEFHDVVGLFVNTLAMRIRPDPAAAFSAVLAHVRDTVLAGHAHQDLPFETVIDMVKPPRSEAHAPLVQTFFSMASAPRAGTLGDKLSWQALPSATQHARFDLALEMFQTEHGLRGHFTFARDLFDEARVQDLAARFETLLTGLCEAEDTPLCDVPLLSPTDRNVVHPPVTHPVSTSPNGGVITFVAPTPGVPVFDSRVQDHLGQIAAGFTVYSSIQTGCKQGTVGAVLAQSIGDATGLPCTWDGPENGILIDQTTRVTLGDISDPRANLVSIPELLCAFVRRGGGLMPAPGVRAIILGPKGALLPPGMPGRLAVGGAGLARGYLNDPGATAVRFQPNTWADPHELDAAETCLFVTDHIARLNPDGTIVLCDPPQPVPRLAASDTPAPDARKEGAYVAPMGHTERQLATLWADVLGAAPGRDDTFFERGGDSIRAVQIASRAADVGLVFDPRDLFRYPSIAALAPHVRAVEDPSQDAMPDDMNIDLDALSDLVSFDEE